MPKAIGIDLGTTNSVMAQIRGANPRIIDNRDAVVLTPSVVGIDTEGQRLIGREAKQQALYSPKSTIFSIKRFMGRQFADPDIQRDVALMPFDVREVKTARDGVAQGEIEVQMGGQWYSPIQVSAMILDALRLDAEEYLGEQVTHAVITVPAHFGQRQREATRQAGLLAGLKVMRILPEPTAAALAFGVANGTTASENVLVFDLGGGTFDVTVMMVAGGNFADIAKTGDNHLGGDDFDQLIINRLLAQARATLGIDLSDDPEALQRLKAAAEETKIALSGRARKRILLPGIASSPRGTPLGLELDLTRAEYEEMIRPLVDRTTELLHQAIAEAHLTTAEIHKVLLVGGSSLTPGIVERLRAEFGPEKVMRNINPMEAVALGAAVQTAIIEPGSAATEETWPTEECERCGRSNLLGHATCWACGQAIGVTVQQEDSLDPVTSMPSAGQSITVQQSYTFPIGVQTVGDVMEVVVEANTFYPTPTPTPHRIYLTTVEEGQRLARMPIYEGFKEKASANQYLGEVVTDLPPGLPKGTEVEVQFAIDDDSILDIHAVLSISPDVKVSTRIDLNKPHHEPPPHDHDGPKIGFDSWREEVGGALAMVQTLLTAFGDLVPPAERRQLDLLVAELGLALHTNNEATGRAKVEELNALLQSSETLVACYLMLVGKTLTGHPLTTPAERRELDEQVRRAEQAMRSGLGPMLAGPALMRIHTITEEIIKRMGLLDTTGGGGGGAGGSNILAGLLGRAGR